MFSRLLVEAFRDDEAGAQHVRSAHFRQAQQELPRHLVETPRIVHVQVPMEGWSRLEELVVPGA